MYLLRPSLEDVNVKVPIRFSQKWTDKKFSWFAVYKKFARSSRDKLPGYIDLINIQTVDDRLSSEFKIT